MFFLLFFYRHYQVRTFREVSYEFNSLYILREMVKDVLDQLMFLPVSSLHVPGGQRGGPRGVARRVSVPAGEGGGIVPLHAGDGGLEYWPPVLPGVPGNHLA